MQYNGRMTTRMTKIYLSYISGLHPWFLVHSPPNPWNFLGVERHRGDFCYVNERWLGVGGCLPVQPTVWLVGWNSQSHPQNLQRGEGAGDGAQSPAINDLTNHADVMKTHSNLKRQNWESFRLGAHTEMLGEWGAWRGMEALCSFPMSSPLPLFHPPVPEV